MQYSGLLWKIAASVLINAASAQDVEECVAADRGFTGQRVRRLAVLACSLLCFVTLCAFAYAEFSALDGDDAGFAAVYQGNGKFEIIVINDSDRELKLQDQMKVMQWSTAKEVEGNPGEIRVEVSEIVPRFTVCGKTEPFRIISI